MSAKSPRGSRLPDDQPPPGSGTLNSTCQRAVRLPTTRARPGTRPSRRIAEGLSPRSTARIAASTARIVRGRIAMHASFLRKICGKRLRFAPLSVPCKCPVTAMYVAGMSRVYKMVARSQTGQGQPGNKPFHVAGGVDDTEGHCGSACHHKKEVAEPELPQQTKPGQVHDKRRKGVEFSGNEQLVPSIGIAQKDDERETKDKNLGCRDCTERARPPAKRRKSLDIFPAAGWIIARMEAPEKCVDAVRTLRCEGYVPRAPDRPVGPPLLPLTPIRPVSQIAT